MVKNTQTIRRRIVRVCLRILLGWRLMGKIPPLVLSPFTTARSKEWISDKYIYINFLETIETCMIINKMSWWNFYEPRIFLVFSNLHIQQFISFPSQNWNHYSSEKSSLKRSFPEKLHNFRNSQITVTIVALVATVVTVQLWLIKYLVNHISKQSCLDLDNFTKLSNSHYNNFCLSRWLCIYYPPTATVKYLFNINKKNHRFILYFFLVYLS